MKYVLAAGHAVVSELFNEKMYKGVKFTTDTSKAIQFDNKTDAEKASVFANTILGTNLTNCKEMLSSVFLYSLNRDGLLQ